MHAIAFAALCAIGVPARCQEQALEMPTLELEAKVVRLPEPLPLQPATVGAADARLTLAEAESLALANHPALREAAAQVQAAQGKWLQVGLRPNPVIGYSGEEIGSSGTAGKQGGFIGQEF